MRITDLNGEAAIEALADIIQPASNIGRDPEMRKLLIKKKQPNLAEISKVIKAHKRDILEIMAVLNMMPVEEYEKTVNVFTLPAQLLDIFNEPQVAKLFGYAVQMGVQTSSSSAMANTTENEN